jgi:O-methyltransferase
MKHLLKNLAWWAGYQVIKRRKPVVNGLYPKDFERHDIQVRKNMSSTGYPPDRIHYVAGMVEETIPRSAPESISILRLDTDWYESTKHELIHLYPRLSRGGVLIIDDYAAFRGARKAVDEFIRENQLCLLLNRIDSDARIAVKL